VTHNPPLQETSRNQRRNKQVGKEQIPRPQETKSLFTRECVGPAKRRVVGSCTPRTTPFSDEFAPFLLVSALVPAGFLQWWIVFLHWFLAMVDCVLVTWGSGHESLNIM
jgi:hypothetical protein